MAATRDPVCPTGITCCWPSEKKKITKISGVDSQSLLNRYATNGENDTDNQREDDQVERVCEWRGFRTLLSLCLPAMFLVVAEWWAFELLVCVFRI